MPGEITNLREILGGLVGCTIMEITQNDWSNGPAQCDNALHLHLSNGQTLSFPITATSGFTYTGLTSDQIETLTGGDAPGRLRVKLEPVGSDCEVAELGRQNAAVKLGEIGANLAAMETVSEAIMWANAAIAVNERKVED
jgi:hypothetical protein